MDEQAHHAKREEAGDVRQPRHDAQLAAGIDDHRHARRRTDEPAQVHFLE